MVAVGVPYQSNWLKNTEDKKFNFENDLSTTCNIDRRKNAIYLTFKLCLSIIKMIIEKSHEHLSNIFLTNGKTMQLLFSNNNQLKHL